MALILKDHNVVFLHIPRTGGHWIKKVLEENNIAVRLVYSKCTVHQKLCPWNYFDDPEAEKARYRCVFVRNPISWYESWWKFDAPESDISDPWNPIRLLPRREGIVDFNEWIELCIKREPAFVTRMFEWYIGPPGLREIDYVGRYEHLQRHLLQILKNVGCDISAEKLSSTPPQNQNKFSGEFEWDEKLKSKVIETEVSCLRRFYADEDNLKPY